MQDDRMDAVEIAQYAGVHRQTVYRWIEAGRFGPPESLETIRSRGRLGRQRLVPRVVVEAVVPKYEAPPPTETALATPDPVA
jgi:predicted site-specific integrase-resolvase